MLSREKFCNTMKEVFPESIAQEYSRRLENIIKDAGGNSSASDKFEIDLAELIARAKFAELSDVIMTSGVAEELEELIGNFSQNKSATKNVIKTNLEEIAKTLKSYKSSVINYKEFLSPLIKNIFKDIIPDYSVEQIGLSGKIMTLFFMNANLKSVVELFDALNNNLQNSKKEYQHTIVIERLIKESSAEALKMLLKAHLNNSNSIANHYFNERVGNAYNKYLKTNKQDTEMIGRLWATLREIELPKFIATLQGNGKQSAAQIFLIKLQELSNHFFKENACTNRRVSIKTDGWNYRIESTLLQDDLLAFLSSCKLAFKCQEDLIMLNKIDADVKISSELAASYLTKMQNHLAVLQSKIAAKKALRDELVLSFGRNSKTDTVHIYSDTRYFNENHPAMMMMATADKKAFQGIQDFIKTNNITATYVGGDDKNPDGHPTNYRVELSVNEESNDKLQSLFNKINTQYNPIVLGISKRHVM